MSSCYYLLYLYMISLKLFTCSQNNFQNSFQCYSQCFKLIESNPYQLNPFKSSEHLVHQILMSPISLLAKVFYQLSSLTIVYYNLVFNISYLTVLVAISANFIPLTHHTILYILHYFPFHTRFILWQFILCV